MKDPMLLMCELLQTWCISFALKISHKIFLKLPKKKLPNNFQKIKKKIRKKFKKNSEKFKKS